jgi:hypothetical protein
MNTDRKPVEMENRKAILSTLWIFAVLNYLYCDIIGLMDSSLLQQFLTGTVEGMRLTQEFLLGAGILMEIPMGMVILSRVLPYRANRWVNIIAGVIMTLVQFSTLFFGSVTNYYFFFSIVEIATTAIIVGYAWKWAVPAYHRAFSLANQ